MVYFLNEDHTYSPCTLLEWSQQFEKGKCVASQEIEGYRISTVWLGIDHNFFGGKPLVFETMIFETEGNNDIYMDRYSTWDEAIKGHKKAIKWVKRKIKHGTI